MTRPDIARCFLFAVGLLAVLAGTLAAFWPGLAIGGLLMLLAGDR